VFIIDGNSFINNNNKKNYTLNFIIFNLIKTLYRNIFYDVCKIIILLHNYKLCGLP
jgi:hypothetical protein